MYTVEFKGITVTCDDYHKIEFTEEQNGDITILSPRHDIKFTVKETQNAR